MEFGFFLFFAVVAVASALLVVIARSPIHSALALMVCLVQVAALVEERARVEIEATAVIPPTDA